MYIRVVYMYVWCVYVCGDVFMSVWCVCMCVGECMSVYVCDVSCTYMNVQVHIPLCVQGQRRRKSDSLLYHPPPQCLETRFFSQNWMLPVLTWLTGLKGQNPYVRREAASRNVRGRAECSGSLRVWPARSWDSLVSVPVLELKTQAAIFP